MLLRFRYELDTGIRWFGGAGRCYTDIVSRNSAPHDPAVHQLIQHSLLGAVISLYVLQEDIYLCMISIPQPRHTCSFSLVQTIAYPTEITALVR